MGIWKGIWKGNDKNWISKRQRREIKKYFQIVESIRGEKERGKWGNFLSSPFPFFSFSFSFPSPFLFPLSFQFPSFPSFPFMREGWKRGCDIGEKNGREGLWEKMRENENEVIGSLGKVKKITFIWWHSLFFISFHPSFWLNDILHPHRLDFFFFLSFPFFFFFFPFPFFFFIHKWKSIQKRKNLETQKNDKGKQISAKQTKQRKQKNQTKQTNQKKKCASNE